jgi:GDPmannose 4,6-dehydratase
MKKNIIITGVTGQDGAYLANFLLKKNKYNIYGIVRRNSSEPFGRLDFLGIKKNINFVHLDLTEYRQVDFLIKKLKPKMFFNLAAQSFVAYSFDNPTYTDSVNSASVINILESIRISSPDTKFYQASSSEMYGDIKDLNDKKLNENSRFNPVSPYAISKLSAYFYTRMYRSAYNIFASNGILFNHESPLRGEQFVTKKVVKGLINFQRTGTPIYLGNIYSRRDWGDAEEYVEMMYKILCLKKPDDYVISTGKSYSIKEFINIVCKCINLSIKWVGTGLSEKAISTDKKSIVIIKKTLFRPHDVTYLLGDCKKAKKFLGWNPKNNLKKLVDKMIRFESEQ